ncbi:uncharacterized protein PpBr36_05760 [Pyricularia pennisetigena]|uniref:uncharacterized protein n=1 Tax=Pyricularia pennisetigena TaxID=1578925 RepID=UPI00114F36F5|nr:uncharacterized protein PpBr36_05760 [Pyricularia pennisetigena]TLS23665.1 hypothetical protein PpBr36_05760 [Pyricularia pennisetigena]
MRLFCDHGLVEAHLTAALNGNESTGYSVHACAGNDKEKRMVVMECISLHLPGREIPQYWLVQRRLLLHADRCGQLLEERNDEEISAWIPEGLGLLYAD